jgi:hypothetical protein
MPPIVEPQTAKAIARSRPWKTAFTVDRVEGRIIAAPIPWRSRAAMRAAPLPEKPATTLAMTNTTMPMRNSLRRPRRSPTRPTVSRSEANTRE